MQEYRGNQFYCSTNHTYKKRQALKKTFFNLLAKPHHSSGTVDYWITQKALQNVHLEKRKKNSKWAESFLPLSDDMAEHGLRSPHATGTLTAQRWWERERDWCCVVGQGAR